MVLCYVLPTSTIETQRNAEAYSQQDGCGFNQVAGGISTTNWLQSDGLWLQTSMASVLNTVYWPLNVRFVRIFGLKFRGFDFAFPRLYKGFNVSYRFMNNKRQIHVCTN
jgi:hypothetical protein